MDSITSELRISGSGRAANSLTSTQQLYSIGASPWPTMDVTYSFGTGDNQIDVLWIARDEETTSNAGSVTVYLPKGESHVIDLTDLRDYEGNTFGFARVKKVMFVIQSPDGKKSVIFGPQGETDAAPLWFRDATASEDCFTYILKDRPIGGWEITPTEKVLVITNPLSEGTGDDDIYYSLLIAGVKQ